jgi:hypothetical protein
MKSIIQEASSIEKAIKLGIAKAGNPKEFTIKILETPVYSLFGLITKRSAKIALYFSQSAYSHEQPSRSPNTFTKQPIPQRPLPQRTPRTEQPRYQQREQASSMQTAPTGPRTRVPQQYTQRPEQYETPMQPDQLWNEEIAIYCKTWLTNVLGSMGFSNVTFTIQPQMYYLRVTLSQSLIENQQEEKHLFSSLSLLMLETAKRKFKTRLHGGKVIVTKNV